MDAARADGSREAIETRHAGRIKMGYYPTPLSVVYRIRSFLGFPDRNANVLDPCCGEGEALRALVEGTRAATYGVEPDEHRAGQAKYVLGHVLHCGYEDARISNAAFSCLFLNPPYDWQAGESEDPGHERTEKAFLKGTMRYVQPEGALVYIVPQPRVTADVARVLSYRFGDIEALRFPDPEYEQFRQVVVFGRKKAAAQADPGALEMLGAVPYVKLDELPRLKEPRYALPASPAVGLFRSEVIDPAELEEALKSSPLWPKLRGGANGGKGLGRPPLPLHTGHLGLLLASGCLDGVVGEGDDRHVVRGKVEKVTHTEQEYEGDVLVEREIERYRVSIKVLTQDGEIRNLV